MAAQPRKHQRRESDIDVASHARAMGTEEAASPSQLKRKLSLNTNARAQPFPSPATYYSSQPHPPPPTHRRSPSMMEEEDGSNATDSPSNQPLSASTSKSMPFKVKGDDGNAQGQDKSKQPERTGRACLACRRLKARSHLPMYRRKWLRDRTDSLRWCRGPAMPTMQARRPRMRLCRVKKRQETCQVRLPPFPSVGLD